MEYLLDTDVCIDIIRSKSDSLLRKVCAMELEQLSISTVTLAELEYGAAKSAFPERNSLALTQFTAPLKVRELSSQAAQCYGQIRSELEQAGQRIGSMDMLIAAQALADNLVMISNNHREFRRISGLSCESWYEFDDTENPHPSS